MAEARRRKPQTSGTKTRRTGAKKSGKPEASTRGVDPTGAGNSWNGTPGTTRVVRLRVNGRDHDLVLGRDFEAQATLAWVLRERLGLTGLKVACDEGACGACTVSMDGRAVLSCMMLAMQAQGHEIVTIEGLAQDDPVVAAFATQCEHGHGTALQCGYCTPGFVMTARTLLWQNPSPSLDEVKEALAGNICRCGCYAAIATAVMQAAQKSPRKPGGPTGGRAKR